MKNLCPICSSTLLRHLHQHEIAWFCPRCRQEMLNLDLGRSSPIHRNLIHQKKQVDQLVIHCVQTKTITNDKVIDGRWTILDSSINESKTRLEVVSFILNQIESIVTYSFADTEEDGTPKISPLNKLNAPEANLAHQNNLIKANFLRVSEIILLYICQAILVHEISVINNQSWHLLHADYAQLKLPVEQLILILDLIKTSALDFIGSIAFDSCQSLSPQIADCLEREVASYFDAVRELIVNWV